MKELHKKIFTAFILGINSALPSALIASLLKTMLSDYNVDITYIGLFSMITLPFSYKYLWSPILDNTNVPIITKLFGKRKSWILVNQIFLIIFIVIMGSINPSKNLYMVATIALIVAFFSASSDIIIDAFRIEIFDKNEQGVGATVAIYGYRVGMIISGAGGLYIASYLNWFETYSIMALLLIPGLLIILFSPYGKYNKSEKANPNIRIIELLYTSFAEPIKSFIKQKRWYLLLLFMALYKLSDAYLGAMTIPFLLEEGYSKIEIANAVKSFGLIATILGTAAGGYLTYKWSKGTGLLIAEILAMLSNLPFLLLLKFHNIILLALINAFENFTSALSNIALVAFISNISKNKYAATYYAVLSSFAMFGRSILSASSGKAASVLGWGNFFIFSAALSIPCFIVMYYLFFKKVNS